MRDVNRWINELNLQRHPEGGYYSSMYRSEQSTYLPLKEGGDVKRDLYSSIYYLLRKTDISRLHRLASDEIWHFYDGGIIKLHIIDLYGNY